MPDQPEVVAAEVPVEDQVDAPLKEAAKEAVEAPADNGECAAEEAPAEQRQLSIVIPLSSNYKNEFIKKKKSTKKLQNGKRPPKKMSQKDRNEKNNEYF